MIGLRVGREGSGWRAEVRLDRPVRTLRHTPSERGSTLRIEVEPLALAAAADSATPSRREVLVASRDSGGPLREVSWEPGLNGSAVVELHFVRPTSFRVEQGGDLATLVISIDAAAAVPRDRPSGQTAAPTAAPSGSRDVRMVEARRAITDGQLDRATALLRKAEDAALERGDDAEAAEAMELLGLVHERRGQRSHARAEYEEILQRWPDSPVAGRVRQRLEALILAEAPPREPLRAVDPAEVDGIRAEAFGTVGASYRRFETIDDDAGGRVLDSSGIADLTAFGRLESPSFLLGGELVGSYRYDFVAGRRGDDARISRLLVRASDPEEVLSGTLGRQARSNGGVLGRFDGAHVAARVADRVTLSGLFGFTSGVSSSISFDTDEMVFGGAVDVTHLPFGLDGQLYVVGQRDLGRTDRVAVGGELRLVRPGMFGLVFLDYDVYFQSLNTALVTGNVTFARRTDLNVLAEVRNAPVLTLGNALIGQPVTDLDDLHTLFSWDEIRELAEDRTARSWTASVGLTHRWTDRFQLSGDVTLNGASSTPASGGVLGTPAIGPETSIGLQAAVSDFLVPGAFGTAAVRYFAGEFVDTTTMLANTRFPVPLLDGLRLGTRLRADYRQGTQDQVELLPSLRADWRGQRLLVEAGFGLDWVKGLNGAAFADQLAYFTEVILRWDF